MKGKILSTDSLKSTSASSGCSEELLETTLFPDYEDLTFVSKISEAKFPVYLVVHNPTNRKYAMKVFPWEDGKPSAFFTREIGFAQITHSNIIPIIYYEFEQVDSSLAQPVKFSYILMEYAQHGDFFDIIVGNSIYFNETLVRTYFHQLVKGIEALHAKGTAHLDLKLENLLMNEDFSLKITDFDLGYLPEDGKVKTRGTKNFRAPEVLDECCTDPQAADIYSLGIILFMFKTGGIIPFNEEDVDMQRLKLTNPKLFWQRQCEILNKKPAFFSEDFKALFLWMTKPDSYDRPSLSQIKKSSWYNREVYSEEELFNVMDGRF